MNEIRMLAAIMFTDMVGFTAIMQENEKLAKSLRDRQKNVLERCTLEHRGQILQYYGDGTLIIFGSAIEAAICAAKVQVELQKEPKVPIRIGIHSGDIVYDDEGIYGDGVNVASRIENIALPGSVLISQKINDELKNQKDISTKYIGSFQLKNVKDPVKIFAVESNGLVVPRHDQIEGKITVSDHSIAVLPFINMSIDKENDYFSDGMTEEILNALAKVNGLMVTSRTSSFALKGKNSDIREIGKMLGVKSVLEGSVRKYGNKVRVTAQLINTDDGYHKWSDTYDSELEDIFSVQDEIAKSIVEQLKKTLSLNISSRPLVKIPTDNIEAYNLYLKALYHWNKWTNADINLSIKYCEEALKIAPDFASAYARLSACYVYSGAVGYMPNDKAYSKAREYAEKSLQLDDCLPASHLSLAMLMYFNDWDWKGAEKCFMKALEINPNSAEAHEYYSMLLTTLGHHKKALKEAEMAFALDPLNAPISHILAFTYYNNNLIEDSFAQHEKTKEIEPGFGDSWNSLAWMYLKTGEYEKGIELMRKVDDQPGNKSKALSGLGYAYAKLGDIEKAETYIKELKSMEVGSAYYSMEVAAIYVGLKNFNEAFKQLDIALDKKCGGMNFIMGNYWKEIHDDPRFKIILDKMGISAE